MRLNYSIDFTTRTNHYLAVEHSLTHEILVMDVQKLAKVLALAASDNETEGLAALRTAKRLLDGHGADFVELARRLSEGGPGRAHTDALEDAVFDLRNEVRHLRGENKRLRQSRPAVAEPAPTPASLQEAAKEAATAIRLRAELARITEELEGTRNETLHLQAVEATMREQFREALAEAGRVGVKLSEAETRRMRLEAENRRLLHANHALKVELDEAKTAQGRAAVELVAQEAVHNKPKRAPRGKGKAASQYPLL